MTAAKYWEKISGKWVQVPQGISKASADTYYVNVEGDSMTGPLNLAGAPASGTQAVNKTYADGLITAHEGKTDPHPVYLTQSEGDARYSNINHTHPSTTEFKWNYDSVATMADPGSGKIRTNTAAGVPSTEAAVSKFSQDGLDVTNILMSLTVGDLIYFQEADNAANWGRYSLTADPIDNGTWWQFPVESVEQEGAGIAKNQIVLVRFTYGGAGGGGGGGGYVGTWNSTTDYTEGSIVQYSGMLWGCEVDVPAGGPAPGPGVVVTGDPVPIGSDLVANAAAIQIAPPMTAASSVSFSNTGYITESGELGGRASYLSAWWKYSPLGSGSVTFDTVGSGGDTYMSLYRYAGAGGTVAFSDLVILASDDDSGGAGGASRITYSVAAGTTYYIQVGSYYQTVITYKLNIFNAQPAYIFNPWRPLPSGHTIQDEGVTMDTRANLNFIGGGVTTSDSAGTNTTNVFVAQVPVIATWSMGPLVVATAGGYKWRAKSQMVVRKIWADLGTAPGPSESFSIDVRKNGSSILSTTMDFPTGTMSVNGIPLGAPPMSINDYLEVVVLGVSGDKARNLVVSVELSV